MKKTRLEKDEKILMRKRIFGAAPKSFISPYFSYFFSKTSFSGFSKIAGISLLILLVGTGGLSYASTGALPGDFLYAIKINLKEKIEEGFTFTPESKIALRQKRIQTRFAEVESLIKENRITPENRSIAESSIKVEKEKIVDDLKEINKENPEAAAAAAVDLESSIQVKQDQIDTQIENNDEIESIGKELENAGTDVEEKSDADLKTLDDSEKADQSPAKSDNPAPDTTPAATSDAPAAE